MIAIKPRRFRASFDLSASTVAKAIGDTNVLCEIPEGYSFDHVSIVSSVGLSTATLSIGTAAVPAKYLAASTIPTADLPVTGGKAAARAGDPPAIKDVVLMTIGALALPNAGILVIDVFASGR